jgi:DNA repair protein RadD
VLYYVQNDVLFNSGHLAPLKYFSFNVIDRTMLSMNSSGTDFTDASMKAYYRSINMPKITIEYANRLLKKRNNLLVFSALIEEAMQVAKGVPGSVVITGETEMPVRTKILNEFKAGKIRCVINVGVLTTGFDYPELEAVLIARSTMSLALFYQIVGRVMRPFKYADGSVKEGWVVDLGGNINQFGKIETMKITKDEKGLYMIVNNGRQLTNMPFSKAVA